MLHRFGCCLKFWKSSDVVRRTVPLNFIVFIFMFWVTPLLVEYNVGIYFSTDSFKSLFIRRSCRPWLTCHLRVVMSYSYLRIVYTTSPLDLHAFSPHRTAFLLGPINYTIDLSSWRHLWQLIFLRSIYNLNSLYKWISNTI